MSKKPHGESEREPDVHAITDARVPHTDEMRGRMIKYSVSMGIRVVCLLLVFVVDGWLQWAFVAGAVFLPYFAVIIANGGSDTSKLGHSESLLDAPPARELEEGPGPDAEDASRPGTESGESADPDAVLQGEVVDDNDEAPREDETNREVTEADDEASAGRAEQQHDGQEHRHRL